MLPGRLLAIATVGLLLGCRERPADGGQAPRGAVEPSASTAPVATPSARPAAPGESVPAPAAGASARDPIADAVAPVGGNWLRCYANFQPRTRPESDVRRLGLMCGPSNGMKKLSDPRVSTVSDAGASKDHRWRGKAGDCFRIFAVADAGVEDLDVEVFDPKGRRIAFDTTDDRWPVVKPDGPFCVFDDGEYRARVRAQRGGGVYAVQIWRLR